MAMSDNEAIKNINALNAVCWDKDFYDEEFAKAMAKAVKALHEIQQYRAIGTIEEFKDLKEADMKGANRAVDEFANYLHNIAKENNGLRLSSETKSWTHPCIFDYLEEFKNEQTCKEET